MYKQIGRLEIMAGKTAHVKALLFGAEYNTWEKKFTVGIVLVWVFATIKIRKRRK